MTGASLMLVCADGVVKELSSVINCRSLFSTHYHTLMPDFEADPAIYLAHMGCLADAENADEAQTDLDITFLYTLTDGACPQRCVHFVGLVGARAVCQPAPRHSLRTNPTRAARSFGMNVALLGGMPESIVRAAAEKSKALEAAQQQTLVRNQFARMARGLQSGDAGSLAELQSRVHA
eukprot:COSAG02_NODE_6067_length_3828_cov_1.288549_3_plen_178_part_00